MTVSWAATLRADPLGRWVQGPSWPATRLGQANNYPVTFGIMYALLGWILGINVLASIFLPPVFRILFGRRASLHFFWYLAGLVSAIVGFGIGYSTTDVGWSIAALMLSFVYLFQFVKRGGI